ncbi:nitroreductase [uncultured Veillonella sp.]|uniref:nitroreductase n=1 Tax=uncultured Veillonella sp. TaxID=159268 RepID=UPI00260C5B5A|nr:nitroreductase [uncultured Veillonella sp.]
MKMSQENEVLHALTHRRSIRKYKSDAVPTELIDAIVEAGLYAPSGMGKQPVIILAITNKEIRDKLATINAQIMGMEGDPFYGAPVVLVVLANTERPTYVYDGTLVMENLMLAAHSVGLGSCWIHRAKETFERDEWKQFLKDLHIDGEYEGIGNCIIGYADMEDPKAVRRLSNRVYHVD